MALLQDVELRVRRPGPVTELDLQKGILFSDCLNCVVLRIKLSRVKKSELVKKLNIYV